MRVTWTFHTGEVGHTVTLTHGWFSGRRVITLDGDVVVNERPPWRLDLGSRHPFPVGAGSEAVALIVPPGDLTLRFIADLHLDGELVEPSSPAVRRVRIGRWWHGAAGVAVFVILLGWSISADADRSLAEKVPGGGVVQSCSGGRRTRCEVIYRFRDGTYTVRASRKYQDLRAGDTVAVFVDPATPTRMKLHGSGPSLHASGIRSVVVGAGVLFAYAVRLLLRPRIPADGEVSNALKPLEWLSPSDEPRMRSAPGGLEEVHLGPPTWVVRTIVVIGAVLTAAAVLVATRLPATGFGCLLVVGCAGVGIWHVVAFRLDTTSDALVVHDFGRTERIPWSDIAGFGVFTPFFTELLDPRAGGLVPPNLFVFRWGDRPSVGFPRYLGIPLLLLPANVPIRETLAHLRDELEQIRLARSPGCRSTPPELEPYLSHQRLLAPPLDSKGPEA